MPMKTIDGYSKEKFTDDYVLLAGGSAKALSDFIGALSWDNTNKKIKYTPVGGSATDLVTLSWDNISGKPSSFTPATHNHDDKYVELTGDTMSGDLIVSKNATGDTFLRAVNTNGSISLLTSSNRGVYNSTGTAGWLIGTNGTNSWLGIGNVGVGTNSPTYKLDIAGTVRATNQISSTLADGTAPFVITSTTRNENLNADLLDGEHSYYIRSRTFRSEYELFDLEPILQSSDITTWNGGEIVTTPLSVDANGVFSNSPKALLFTVYKTFYVTPYLPIKPGRKIRLEVTALRMSDATGTAGALYFRVYKYGKNKEAIAATTYASAGANNVTIPCDSLWHTYGTNYTPETSGTAYDTSGYAGDGVRYIRLNILVNYSKGTIPTYIGSVKAYYINTNNSSRYAEAIRDPVNYWYTSSSSKARISSLNSIVKADGALYYYNASSQVTAAEGYPGSASHVLHMAWDNGVQYESQFAVPIDNGQSVKWRTMTANNTWGDWKVVLDSSNFGTYAAAASHNHAASDITSGTLAISRGGTNKSSWTQYGIVYASATDTLAQIALPTWAASTTYWLKCVTNASKVPTYSLSTLSKSDIGLGNVENTALSTWAGSTNITTLGTIATGTWSATTIAVNKGGTGKTSWTKYGIVYASDTTTLAQIALPTWAASTTYFLKAVTNASKVPTYSLATIGKADVGLGNVDNTADANKTVAAAGKATNLAGGAAGSIPYQTAANTTAFLAASGTNGYVLAYNTSTNKPYWKADANDNTWRGVYVAGTSKLGTGTDTKALNFVAGTGITIEHLAAGTGDGQSGNANYSSLKITNSGAPMKAYTLPSSSSTYWLPIVKFGGGNYSRIARIYLGMKMSTMEIDLTFYNAYANPNIWVPIYVKGGSYSYLTGGIRTMSDGTVQVQVKCYNSAEYKKLGVAVACSYGTSWTFFDSLVADTYDYANPDPDNPPASTIISSWTVTLNGHTLRNLYPLKVAGATTDPDYSIGSSTLPWKNLYLSGQATFSVATGTAPMVVTSTTKVANLNADYLDGNHASAFASASHEHSAADITSGTLGVARGGTGKASWTQYGIVYASTTTALAQISQTWAASKTYWLKATTSSSSVPTYSFVDSLVADKVKLTSDSTTTSWRYIPFAASTSGDQAFYANSSIGCIPSIGSLEATYLSGLNVTGMTVYLCRYYRGGGSTSSTVTPGVYYANSTTSGTVSGTTSRIEQGKYTITLTNNTPIGFYVWGIIQVHYSITGSGSDCYEFGWANWDPASSTGTKYISPNGGTQTFTYSCGYIHAQGSWSTSDFVKRVDTPGITITFFGTKSY